MCLRFLSVIKYRLTYAFARLIKKFKSDKLRNVRPVFKDCGGVGCVSVRGV